MQIFVKILYGQPKTISLEVEPDDKIQDVASSILEKEEISKDSQKATLLSSDKIQLDLYRTLSQYAIQEGSLLCCSLVANISVHHYYHMEQISINVEACDTIQTLKHNLKKRFEIPAEQQWLFISKDLELVPLENEKTMSDYNVQNRTEIHLVLKLHDGRQVFVKTPSGKTITLDINSCDPMSNVKSMIESVEGIPSNKQQFIFPTYDMFNCSRTTPMESTIHLIVPGSIRVSVMHSRYGTISLDVEPTDTVENMKMKIQDKVRDRRAFLKHQLTFNGNVLDDDKLLSHCNIEDGSSILMQCKEFPQVMLHVVNAAGQKLTIKTSVGVSFEYIINLIGRWYKMHPDTFYVIFDGTRVTGYKTLQDYEVEDDDTLEIFQNQCGGGSKAIQIFVIMPNGKTISIAAIEDNMIRDIKSKIEEKEHIDVDQQCLLLANRQLEDNKQLTNYCINDNTTLRLVLKSATAVGEMALHVQLPSGNTLTFYVMTNASIASCKRKIEEIPFDQQIIIFNGKKLSDSSRLIDYNIHGESLLHVARANGTIVVHIKGLDQKEIVSLPVEPSDSVLCLKARLSIETSAPPCKQRLLVNNEEMRESRSLSFYSIPPNNVVTLSVLIRVFIKTFNRKEVSKIKIFEDELVSSLKYKIKEKIEVEPTRQQLYCEGLLLEDDRTVASYGIVEDSLINLRASLVSEQLPEAAIGQSCGQSSTPGYEASPASPLIVKVDRRFLVPQNPAEATTLTRTPMLVSYSHHLYRSQKSQYTEILPIKLPKVSTVTILNVDTHLRPVKRAVWEVRSRWKEIGRALGLTEGTINSIREQDDGESLHKVITKWMHSGKAKIQDLLEALEDPTVDRTDIANEIRSLKGKDRTAVGL